MNCIEALEAMKAGAPIETVPVNDFDAKDVLVLQVEENYIEVYVPSESNMPIELISPSTFLKVYPNVNFVVHGIKA